MGFGVFSPLPFWTLPRQPRHVELLLRLNGIVVDIEMASLKIPLALLTASYIKNGNTW